jgi:hypothetical protein
MLGSYSVCKVASCLLPLSAFPSSEGAGIDSELSGELALSDAESLPVVDQFLSQIVTPGEGIESKELDHSSHVMDARVSVSLLPIHEGQRGASDCPCHVLLQELKVEAALPNGFSDGLQVRRIPRVLPKVWTLLATQPPQCQVAKRQRIPVRADASGGGAEQREIDGTSTPGEGFICGPC